MNLSVYFDTNCYGMASLRQLLKVGQLGWVYPDEISHADFEALIIEYAQQIEGQLNSTKQLQAVWIVQQDPIKEQRCLSRINRLQRKFSQARMAILSRVKSKGTQRSRSSSGCQGIRTWVSPLFEMDLKAGGHLASIVLLNHCSANEGGVNRFSESERGLSPRLHLNQKRNAMIRANPF